MSIEYAYGSHSAFYYYGLEHLRINMYSYIKNSIAYGNFIYLYMESDLYDSILKLFNDEEVALIKPFPMDCMVAQKHTGYTENLREAFILAINDAKKDGLNGIEVIGQPSHAIQNIGKDIFMELEKCFTNAVQGLPASLMCVYDFEDYMYKQTIITDEIMAQSKLTHTHTLRYFKLASNL